MTTWCAGGRGQREEREEGHEGRVLPTLLAFETTCLKPAECKKGSWEQKRGGGDLEMFLGCFRIFLNSLLMFPKIWDIYGRREMFSLASQ